MNRVNRHIVRAVSWTISLAALAAASSVAAKNWDDWSAPANLNSLSSLDINTPSVDGCASHSPDSLTIAFNSNRSGTPNH